MRQREKRQKVRKDKRESWYNKGNCETILFVDATQIGTLADRFRKVQETPRL